MSTYKNLGEEYHALAKRVKATNKPKAADVARLQELGRKLRELDKSVEFFSTPLGGYYTT